VELGSVENCAVENASVPHPARRETVLDMTDEDLQPGDWVVIHSGFALERISKAQAIDALAIRATPAAPQQKEMAP
jgi:hydrogenase maturation factor